MPSDPIVRRLLPAMAAALALAGCASIGENVGESLDDMVGDTVAATLSGAAATAPGDPDGRGRARVTVNDVTNQVCTQLQAENIGALTAAHIHRGAPGVDGPPVIALVGIGSDNCDTESGALVDEIRRNPGRFYVDVHTAAFPKGAVRGQLRHDAD